MSWQFFSKPNYNSSTFDIYNKQKIWVFRIFDGLQAWDEDQNQIIWSTQFEGDKGFGYKGVVANTEVLITLTHLNQKSNEVYLKAVNIKSGNLIWESPIQWRLNKYFGGLNLHLNQLITIENTDKPVVVIRDIFTGQNLKEYNIGIDFVPNYSLHIGNKIYYSAYNKGLYKLDLENSNDGWSQLIQGNVGKLFVNNNKLYILHSFQENNQILTAVLINNLITDQTLDKIILNNVAKPTDDMFLTFYQENLFIQLGYGKKTVIYDQEKRQNVSELSLIIKNAINTNYGIVGIIAENSKSYIAMLDKMGNIIEQIQTKNQLTHLLFFKKDFLIVDTLTGPEFFKWEQ